LAAQGYVVSPDGAFGPQTDGAVRDFQKDNFLTADGIAGQKTQMRLIQLIDVRTHTKHDELPVGLLRGFSETEGGNNVGAVNWNVSGGVDCGVMQVRVYGPPYDAHDMRGAYDPDVAMERIASGFVKQAELFRGMAYARTQRFEFAQRCAGLAWNWPYAAEQYAKNGGLPLPNRDATWAVYVENGVKKRVKFPDGAPVQTWKDWAQFYAMGGMHGEGRVMRYVKW